MHLIGSSGLSSAKTSKSAIRMLFIVSLLNCEKVDKKLGKSTVFSLWVAVGYLEWNEIHN